jgi:hypothetical protein
MSEYAERAVQAAENINTRLSSDITVGGIKALTYAILDLAEALRERDSRA